MLPGKMCLRTQSRGASKSVIFIVSMTFLLLLQIFRWEAQLLKMLKPPSEQLIDEEAAMSQEQKSQRMKSALPSEKKGVENMSPWLKRYCLLSRETVSR